MRCVLYASDHGFGHATRLFALAQVLVRHGHPVTLCAGAAAQQVGARWSQPAAASIPSAPLQVIEARLDFGLSPARGAVGVDAAATRARLSDLCAGFPALVEREAERLRALQAELVIADAPAAAVAAAARVGVPAVVCSNFTWADVYEDHYGAEPLRLLRQAYATARFGLRLGIGRLPLDGVPRLREVSGVLGRRPLRGRAQIRAALGLTPQTALLGLGLGRSYGPEQAAGLRAALQTADQHCNDELRVLAPQDLLQGAAPPRLVVTFPAEDPQAQDYFAACDAVLAKGGYSTIAEAALAGVPLLVFPVAGNRESDALCRDTQALGLGLALPDEAAAQTLLADPARALTLARGRHLAALPEAGEEILRILQEEGLLPTGIDRAKAGQTQTPAGASRT